MAVLPPRPARGALEVVAELAKTRGVVEATQCSTGQDIQPVFVGFVRLCTAVTNRNGGLACGINGGRVATVSDELGQDEGVTVQICRRL